MRLDLNELKPIISPWLRENAPGAQLAVRYKGEVWHQCFGLADIERAVPIHPETVFHVASVSKQITCFCVLLLHERGLLDIDNDVRVYLPDLIAFDEPVTVRDMMNNVSGIRDQWSLQIMRGVRMNDHIMQKDMLHITSLQKSLNFRPRSQYLYSNANFSLLAEIVARVSGRSFAAFAKENIFDPLGMTHTLIRETYNQLIPNRALSYIDLGNDDFCWEPLNFSNYGATSLHTTALDFLLWLSQLREPTLCRPETLEIMFTVPQLTSPDAKTIYACGVTVGEENGHKVIGHDGADAGYRSCVVCFPQDELEVAVFANVVNVSPNRVAHRIVDMILQNPFEDKPFAYHETYYSDVQTDIVERVGEYLLGTGRFVTIEKRADEFHLVMDDCAVRLIHMQGNCYRCGTFEQYLYVLPDGLQLCGTTGDGNKLSAITTPHFSQAELDDIAGIYHSAELDMYYTVKARGTELYVCHPRYGEGLVCNSSSESFVIKFEMPQRCAFKKGRDGHVELMEFYDGRVLNFRFYKTALLSN